ncbi:glycoside hydrolase family 88 protein [Microbulbifer hainanensis]|uniref:glycoside hydrolase family 88 protein n=1 Tax=Microbulbifer hainanensis TaxID=2735675 RepID=UPI001D02F51A|nr:glycoside hydrolase family 88 protein [Microbulbifer hainanensis]
MKLVGRLSLISLVVASLAACSEKPNPAAETQAAQPQATKAAAADIAQLELSNPSNFARRDESVYLSFLELGLPADPQEALAVWQGGEQLPLQIVDRDADGSSDGILFTLDIAAAATAQLRIAEAEDTLAPANKRTQAELSRKTGGQWKGHEYEGGHFENVQQLEVPEEHTDHSWFIRYEGPGIESDLVGYRVYLDWRNGFDIFGKRTPAPVLQDVGQDGFDSYHEMSDWGMDILKVGDALGIGGYGYWDGDKAVRVSDVQHWSAQVVDNGPLFSQFAMNYSGWQPVDGENTDLHSTLSMHAGSRLVEVNAHTSAQLKNMVTGLVKLPDTQLLVGDMNITGKAWTYIGTYGKQSLDGSKLGMGLLLRKQDIEKVTEDDHNQIVVLDPAGKQIHYYFAAAWEQETPSDKGPITDAAQFEQYLQREAEKLTMPLRKRLTTRATTTQVEQPLTAEAALQWSQRLADSELQRSAYDLAFGGFDPHRKRPAYFEYTTGLLMQAFDDLYQVAPEARYTDVIQKVMGSFVNDDGSINGYVQSKYNIDSINAGKMLLRMFERNEKSSYKAAVDKLHAQLEDHPRTSAGAFWHKKRYPYQVWLDGVYMGMPFLAHYDKLTQDHPDFDDVLAEFKVVHEKLRDPETGLYYHAWDEKRAQDWADPDSGLSAYHWSRGMGWMAMALVDVLDYIPAEEADQRAYLKDMIRELAPVLKKYQDAKSGTWFQITDKPNAPGNYREASGSSMFTYFLAKAINKGYLPESYVPLAKKSYRGLLNEFVQVHHDGSISLTNVCEVAGLGYGRDGSYRYYMSEPVIDDDLKGAAPFIMAGVQMHELLKKRS